MENSIPEYTLNVGGRLFSLKRPVVMGILNLTPDSFYSDSRMLSEEGGGEAQIALRIRQRVRDILDEGGDMIDVGACSTRPGSDEVSTDEEMRRLAGGLQIIREEAPGTDVRSRFRCSNDQRHLRGRDGSCYVSYHRQAWSPLCVDAHAGKAPRHAVAATL